MLTNATQKERQLEFQLELMRGEAERHAEAHQFWFWVSVLTVLAFLVLCITYQLGGKSCS